jgi:DNA-binding transcriptional LysR family regulator
MPLCQAHAVGTRIFEAALRDVALRVVRANLAISVVPCEVARPFAELAPVHIVTLSAPWAQRRFTICYRNAHHAPPLAAQLLVDYLARQAPPL